MDPNIKLIKDQVKLISEVALLTHDKTTRQVYDNTLDGIVKGYEAAMDKLADEKATEAEKKYAKDITDAINKNLPNMTKAALSAASAFNSGDYINGSAAIMDICASGAQFIGSLSAAAGPFGAVFGAIFSIVGQLLTYFGPKQPSLTKQIEAILDRHDAKKTLQFAEADGDVVEEYTKTVYRIASSLPNRLKSPLPKTAEKLKDFHIDLGKDYEAIKGSYSKISVLYNKWVTARWLMDKDNQELEKWPEILGVFCRVYSDSLLANMALASLVDRQSVDQRLAETTKRGNPNYDEHEDVLKKINALLDKLLIKVNALPELWEDGNEKMQQFLERIRPVAQDRGLFVHLGTNQYLYAATGRKSIQSDSWKNLSIGYGGRGHRFSLTVAKEDVGSLTPEYHIFFCEHWQTGGGGLEHGRVSPSPVGISGQGPISDKKFSDVWALPASKAQKSQKRDSFVYVATDGETSGSVKGYELDEKNQFKDGNWGPVTKSGVMNVRAVIHPPAALPNDPDKDGMPPGSSLLGGVDHYNPIIYGALRASSELYVNHSNTGGYVPTPWGDYTGIEVDPYYIWVFRQHAVACATHASVIKCLQGKRPMPRWMEHGPNDVLGDQSRQGEGNLWLVNGQETKPRPALKGLISFSPCIDGTFYASIYNRTVTKSTPGGQWLFEAKDTLGSYTTRYNIDLKAGRLNVDPWVKCGGVALQVQKMPIPSWSLFESLETTLKEKLMVIKKPNNKEVNPSNLHQAEAVAKK